MLFFFKESEVELQKALRVDMDNRLEQLRQRLSNLRMESEEVWKTLETAETSLLGMLNAKVSFTIFKFITRCKNFISDVFF